MSSDSSKPRPCEPALHDVEREARRLQRVRRLRVVEPLPPAKNRLPGDQFDPDPKEAA
jgi:hypothetical protein